MERGVTMLVRIMVVAFVVGGAVIALHPDYRDTAKAMWWGDVEASAIWESNRAYYAEVVHEMDVMDEMAE